MNVLITGASGLVGGRLIAKLSRGGSARIRAASRICRPWPAGVEGVITDASLPATLEAACGGVDAVINLASMPEVACAADPQGALRTNAGGTLALMRAASVAGVARFVQLSTSKVYGNNRSGVVTEETVPRPVSHYSITHRAAEDYALLHPGSVVLRLANGFGAPVDPDTPCWGIIVNDFCRQAVTTRRIAIRGDGMAWRNFVPLDDVVAALEAAAATLPAGIFNLGAAQSMTIRNMAERVAAVCETELGYRVDVSVGEIRVWRAAGAAYVLYQAVARCGVALEGQVDVEIARTLLAARMIGGEVRGA